MGERPFIIVTSNSSWVTDWGIDQRETKAAENSNPTHDPEFANLQASAIQTCKNLFSWQAFLPQRHGDTEKTISKESRNAGVFGNLGFR